MASEWALQLAARAWCTDATSRTAMDVGLAGAFADILDAERAKACAEPEQLRVQLAGCGVAARGGTRDPAREGDYGWSPAYQDVLDLRLEFERTISSGR